MHKAKMFKNGFSIFALIAFIIAAIISIVSVSFPGTITDITKQAINFDKFRDGDGAIRPAVVLAQVNVLLFAMVIIILIWGFAESGIYFAIRAREASSIAVGGNKKTWQIWVFAGIVLILFSLLGIGLPRAIFNPTDMRTLSMVFPLAHFAANSRFGGVLVLGIGGGMISVICATILFWLLIKLPRTIKEGKLKKTLRLQ